MLQYLVASYLLLSKVILVSCTDAEGSCPSVVYLKVGEEGRVPCLRGNFTIVSWYIGEEHEAGRSPVINYDKVQKRGYGYTAGEYDIEENGALIIMTVKRQHEGYFVVTVADDIQRREETISIEVIVIVPAVPSYPVVNDKINQQHVYMDVNTDGMLRCAMFGVHPAINLTWTSQSNKISFQNDDLIKTPCENDAFDISLTTRYSLTDLTLERLTIYCEVADEIAEYFPGKAIVDLLLSSLYPVVNGHISQKHVYLEVEREGYLTCLKENVDVGTRLVWELLDPTMQDRFTFQSVRVISNNIDGTVNINQTFDYEVNDISLERITVECKEMEPDTDPLATRVDLLFQNVYPVVNGHVNQQHVYLDVDREGHLTCKKENVDFGTIVVWVLDTNMRGKVTFESNTILSINNDGTVNINQTFDYEVHDHSLERITIECQVIEPDTDEHPYTTTVELLFSSALNLNNKCVVIPLLSAFISGTALQLIVMSYCFRKMCKCISIFEQKSEANYQELKGCIANCNGHHNAKGPEKAESTDFPDSGNSGSLTSEQSGSEPSEKGPEKAESTDFPDSGNSGSLSTEQSGSEPSEKCGLMEDVEMSCIYSKQGSMDGKRGCSEGDQMA